MTSARWGLVVLVGAMALSLIGFLDPYFESMWDAVLYVLTTRSLLAGEGYTVYGEPFALRPPGFSLLLAPVMATFGTHAFGAFNVFTSLLGILALALAFVLFHRRLGVPLTVALCLMVWISPQYRSACMTTLSDTAGLSAVLACFLIDRSARARPTLARHVALGLAIGAATYLRTVAFLVIPAILLSRLVRPPAEGGERAESGSGRGRALRLGCVVAIPLLLQFPWTAWKAAHPAPVPSVLWGIHSYGTAQWHESASNPDSPRVPTREVLARIPVRVEQGLTALGSRLPKLTIPGMWDSGAVETLREENRRPGGFVLGGLAFLCLLVRGLRRFDAGDVFALGSLATLAIYFDFDERLLIPAYLFVLAAALEALRSLVRRALSEPKATWALTVAVAALGLWDARDGLDRSHVARRNDVQRRIAEYVESEYSEDVVVGASLGHRVAVFLDRPVWFFEVVLNRAGSPGAWRLRRDRGVGVFIDTGPDNGRLREALDTHLGRERVVHRVEDARIFEFLRRLE